MEPLDGVRRLAGPVCSPCVGHNRGLPTPRSVPRTAEKHLERLLAKTNLTNRTELVAYAVHATLSDRDR